MGFLLRRLIGHPRAILFLVMTGMLNHVLPMQSQRNEWHEINNQILDALFTLMSLYHHPKRIYCKNGTYKPREQMNIMVVVVLLHLDCFAQYALCALNLRYKRSERPAIGVGVCLSVAIAAPAIAGVYCIVSSLGTEYEVDSESQDHILTNRTFASRNEQKIDEFEPQWRGGLSDFQDDIATSHLSFFCTSCVFGWDTDRLGFGNMYVHIATLFLFCTAPFWIPSLASSHIDNEIARESLILTGIVVLYIWLAVRWLLENPMRKIFNLPANNLCCGKPAVTDFDEAPVSSKTQREENIEPKT